MNKRQKQKVVECVVRNDRRRLKHYIRKYGQEIVNSRSYGKGRTLLHTAARVGSDYIISYLLKLHADCRTQDDRGNTALHVALQYSLSNYTTTCYGDNVAPLLKACPEVVDVRNNSGIKPLHLLRELEDRSKRARGSPERAEEVHSKTVKDEAGGMGWFDKLADEVDHEYQTSWGAYEEDSYEPTSTTESYDQWADRLHSEYRAKRHAQTSGADSARPRASSKPQWTEQDQSQFEESQRAQHAAREARAASDVRRALTRLKQKYEALCSRVFDDVSCDVIGQEDVPGELTGFKMEQLVAVLLVDMKDSSQEEVKRYLREQQVRWHPDRFLQRCGARIPDEDRDTVTKAVVNISQTINAHMEAL